MSTAPTDKDMTDTPAQAEAQKWLWLLQAPDGRMWTGEGLMILLTVLAREAHLRFMGVELGDEPQSNCNPGLTD